MSFTQKLILNAHACSWSKFWFQMLPLQKTRKDHRLFQQFRWISVWGSHVANIWEDQTARRKEAVNKDCQLKSITVDVIDGIRYQCSKCFVFDLHVFNICCCCKTEKRLGNDNFSVCVQYVLLSWNALQLI